MLLMMIATHHKGLYYYYSTGVVDRVRSSRQRKMRMEKKIAALMMVDYRDDVERNDGRWEH